jgi:hydroxymethylbilane synthase
MAQTRQVASLLQKIEPDLVFEIITIATTGDVDRTTPLAQMGGMGVFAKEIEQALLDDRADIAVHSAKDMPVELPDGLAIGAAPLRENPWDALLTRQNIALADLPQGAVIGTGSPRRQAMLLRLRPDVQFKELRGNIETRIAKLHDGEYDGIILACAALERLSLTKHIGEILQRDLFLPAAAQGIIAVEARSQDEQVMALLQMINDSKVMAVLQTERAFLGGLRGGCHMPAGIIAEIEGEQILARGVAFAGAEHFSASGQASWTEGKHLGQQLGEKLAVQLAQVKA